MILATARLHFCGQHGITADIDIITIQKIDEAYKCMPTDAKCHLVIDMASLSTVVEPL